MSQNRGLKNRTAISTSIKNELYVELKSYSEESGIPISKILDKSILLYLESVKRK